MQNRNPRTKTDLFQDRDVPEPDKEKLENFEQTRTVVRRSLVQNKNLTVGLIRSRPDKPKPIGMESDKPQFK